MVRMYRKEFFKDDSIKNFRLARIRAYRNLTMKELSNNAGISLLYYAEIESMRRYPRYTLRKKISRILKEDIDYLFPENLKEYCAEHHREANGISKDVFDKLNRVGFNLEEFMEIPDKKYFLEELETEDRDEYIERLLDEMGLPEIKREIFYSRFGIGERKFHTFEKLGDIFHVTKARAKQIELEVLRKLKYPERLKKLKENL